MTQRDKLIELLTNCYSGFTTEFLEKTADSLISNGVIVSPCKVGDTVYQTDDVRVYESKVTNIIYDTQGIALAFDERAIGKSVFLTREEAEKALAERKESNGKLK